MWNSAMRCLAALLSIAAITAAPTIAGADNYPSKTIAIIAPASPGGVTDLLARMLARRFIADWGAQAIVENKPGANNQVAAEYVARQPGDGYTVHRSGDNFHSQSGAVRASGLRSGERFHAEPGSLASILGPLPAGAPQELAKAL